MRSPSPVPRSAPARDRRARALFLWASFAIACLASAACVSPARSEGRECLFNRDCRDPLVCAGRACRAPCRTRADCSLGYDCAPSGQRSGDGDLKVCVPPASPRLCGNDLDCDAPNSYCAPDGTCRIPCLADRDCQIADRAARCVAGACTRSPMDASTEPPDASRDRDSASDRDDVTMTTPPIDSALRPRDSAVDPSIDAAFLLRAEALGGRSSSHCAVSEDAGPVFCWGANGSGQLGTTPTIDGGSATPLRATAWDGLGVRELRASGGDADQPTGTMCARLANGTIRCVGLGTSGQLGDGAYASSTTPVVVRAITDARELCLGRRHACAIVADRSVRCWGRNDRGELGRGGVSTVAPFGEATAAPVVGVANAAAIACGNTHTCAIDATDGSVRCWGENIAGEVGAPERMPFATPVRVPTIVGARAIAAGQSTMFRESLTCVIVADRTIRCWGSNSLQQLGQFVGAASPTPVAIMGVTDAELIATTGAAVCVVRASDRRVSCWGSAADPRFLANPSRPTDWRVPFEVAGVPAVRAFVAGGTDVDPGAFCALAMDGSIWCWGSNHLGQLGNGASRPLRPIPVFAPGVS